MLFAHLELLQRNVNDPGAAARPVFGLGLLIVEVVVAVLFFNVMATLLRKVRPRNRTMEPGNVWLNLIPCFNLVYIFITIGKLSESLANEYEDRGLRDRGDFGKSTGTTMAIFGVLGAFCFLLHIGTLILLLQYWQKLNQYTRDLEDDDRDRDDDRPRRRGRDERDDDRPRRDRDDRDDDRGYRDEDDRPSRRRRDD